MTSSGCLKAARADPLEDKAAAGVLPRLGVDHKGVVYMTGAVAHGADELAAEIICGKGLIEQLLSLRHVQTSHSLSGYSPLAVFSAMAATTQGLSSLYVTPYHLSALRRTFTRALPSSSSWVTTLGRKYSPFSGIGLQRRIQEQREARLRLVQEARE